MISNIVTISTELFNIYVALDDPSIILISDLFFGVEVPTALTIFRNVRSCSPVECNRRFGGNYCFQQERMGCLAACYLLDT